MQKEIGWDFAAPEEDLSATAELAVKLASYCQRINAVQAPDAIDKTLVDAALDVSDAAFAASIVVPRAHDGVIAYASRGCLALSPGAFPIDALRQLLGNEPGKGPFTGPTRRLLSAERMRGLRFAGETSRFEEAIVLTLPIWEQDLVSILFVGFRKPPREIADTMEFLDAMLNVASVARWKHLPRQCSVSEHERVVRAKQEWQSSVDVLNQLICLVDRSGSVVRANRTIEQLGLGKVTDVRGRCIWELLAELDDASGRDEDSPVAVWCAELGANWTDHWQAAVDRGGIEWIVRGRAGESLYCVSINLVNMSTPYSKGVEPHAVVVVDDLSRSSSYRDRLQDVSDTPMAAIERQLEALETPDRSAFISDDLLNAQEAERSRVAIEMGLVGLYDPATHWGMERKPEDLGQTFGHWGIGSGAYVVIPILGPSSARDGVGTVGDMVVNSEAGPISWIDDDDVELALNATKVVDIRHKVKFRYGQSGSPFEYELIRMFYGMKRGHDVSK